MIVVPQGYLVELSVGLIQYHSKTVGRSLVTFQKFAVR